MAFSTPLLAFLLQLFDSRGGGTELLGPCFVKFPRVGNRSHLGRVIGLVGHGFPLVLSTPAFRVAGSGGVIAWTPDRIRLHTRLGTCRGPASRRCGRPIPCRASMARRC